MLEARERRSKEEAREVMQKMLWKWWRRNLTHLVGRWLAMQEYLDEHEWEWDRAGLEECVRHCVGSTWWDWDAGSQLMFWCWNHLWVREARDGVQSFCFSHPPPWKKFLNVPVMEEWVCQKDIQKLHALIDKGYLEAGECSLVVPRFPVPKGPKDIRVVWDFQRSGLNDHTYTPLFCLPQASCYGQKVEAGTMGVDTNVKEQFHNYLLHESEWPYNGVEISQALIQEYKDKDKGLQYPVD